VDAGAPDGLAAVDERDEELADRRGEVVRADLRRRVVVVVLLVVGGVALGDVDVQRSHERRGDVAVVGHRPDPQHGRPL
jgi:hypothetical protein